MKETRESYHHGHLREALLAAAVELVGEVGPKGFTMREVARRAGVSHNAPYRHFADREALLGAVAAEGFERLRAAMARAAGRGRTGLERWRLSGKGYIGFALKWPAHFGVMFDAAFEGEARAECVAAGQGAFELLLRYVREAQEEGSLAGRDPMGPALMSWAVAHGLAKLAMAGRLPMTEAEAVRFFEGSVAEALLTGLGKRA